mmetsp:Transcript_70537/g.168967  ORF Transcript_70537/g.168967 Transcript_70537/m.168967 type:complete len:290 (+) Transcript_70537:2270-3139(+)
MRQLITTLSALYNLCKSVCALMPRTTCSPAIVDFFAPSAAFDATTSAFMATFSTCCATKSSSFSKISMAFSEMPGKLSIHRMFSCASASGGSASASASSVSSAVATSAADISPLSTANAVRKAFAWLDFDDIHAENSSKETSELPSGSMSCMTFAIIFLLMAIPLLLKISDTSCLSSFPSPLLSMAWNIVSSASSLISDNFLSRAAPFALALAFAFAAAFGTAFFGPRGVSTPVRSLAAALRKLGPLMLPPTPQDSASFTHRNTNSSSNCDRTVRPSGPTFAIFSSAAA